MSKEPEFSEDARLPDPPVAARRPRRMREHGYERVDDYYWLRQRDDAAVREHLIAENRYTDAVLEPWRDLRAQLVAEMAARMKPDESSVPYRHGDYYYYYRYETGHEYPVYCRKHGGLDAPEQVLLDVNSMAGERDFFALRGFNVAPDHSKAVFGIDTEGRRFFTLQFLNLETGELYADRIERVTSNAEWANDSRTLLYIRQDPDSLRDYQVFRHVLGERQDVLLYEEEDEAYWVGVEKSLSERSLFIVSVATTSTEVRVLSADHPHGAGMLFLPREVDHEYFVTDGGDRFFVLSNDDASNFRLFETPLDSTSRAAWREIVPHRDDVLIEGVDVFAEYIVLSTVESGLDQLEVLDRKSGQQRSVDVDDAVRMLYTHDNFCYESATLRYSYESLASPESTYDYEFATCRAELLRREEIPGGFDAEHYVSERLLVPARDGAKIPVSLVMRKDADPDRPHPLLLYAYGAYGLNVELDFDSNVVSLLDRGFVYAIAHVRGGAELGRQWYYSGRQRAKQNTFNDFVDVAQWLIDAGYTAADRCYASGGSAGGLLIGAVANQAPALFHGMVTRVPFVDVLTTMLDTSIPLTTGEYDEWGDPEDKADYDSMAGYSPYDNVVPQNYPHLLVTTGWHDSQVQYWEPAKWIAKLRTTATGDGLALLRTDMEAGHSGKTGRYRSLDDTALMYTFLLMLEERRRSPVTAA